MKLELTRSQIFLLMDSIDQNIRDCEDSLAIEHNASLARTKEKLINLKLELESYTNVETKNE